MQELSDAKVKRQHLLTFMLLPLVMPLSNLLSARRRHPSSQSCQTSIDSNILSLLLTVLTLTVSSRATGGGVLLNW